MTTRRDQETAAVFALCVQVAVQIGSVDVAKVAAVLDGMATVELEMRALNGVNFRRDVRSELGAFLEQVNRPELLAAARALVQRLAVNSDELVVSDELPPVPTLKPRLLS